MITCRMAGRWWRNIAGRKVGRAEGADVERRARLRRKDNRRRMVNLLRMELRPHRRMLVAAVAGAVDVEAVVARVAVKRWRHLQRAALRQVLRRLYAVPSTPTRWKPPECWNIWVL